LIVSENPNIGRNLDEAPDIQWIKVPNYNYKLFFVNVEERLEILAVAVHHNNRDYKRLLPKLIARGKLDGML
jgi:plasmid stabilization system protein ParE